MARMVTVAVLVAGVLLLAAPASAEHDPDGDGQFCVDSSTAHPGMWTDTMTGGYCVVASTGPPLPFPGRGVDGRTTDGGTTAAIGSVGAVPTRIDAGAGGSAPTGSLAGIGSVLAGAASAAGALAATRRRGRRG